MSDSVETPVKRKVYKAQSDKGLYHWLDNGRTCQGQHDGAKNKFDVSLYEIVDVSQRIISKSLSPKKNNVKDIDISSVDFSLKPRFTKQHYKDIFETKGWGVTDTALKIYVKAQKDIDDVAASIDKFTDRCPSKGIITFDTSLGCFNVSNRSQKKKVDDLTHSVESLSL